LKPTWSNSTFSFSKFDPNLYQNHLVYLLKLKFLGLILCLLDQNQCSSGDGGKMTKLHFSNNLLEIITHTFINFYMRDKYHFCKLAENIYFRLWRQEATSYILCRHLYGRKNMYFHNFKTWFNLTYSDDNKYILWYNCTFIGSLIRVQI
jgi:hypothetical protein